jgi:hypothetical protein
MMVLNDDNYLLYAMHHYTVPSCPTLEEFEADLKTVTYVKRNLAKAEVNTHLLLNHLITLFNCFGDAALNMLLYKMEDEHLGTLATFLIYINRMPEMLPNGTKITDLKLNDKVIEELRNL